MVQHNIRCCTRYNLLVKSVCCRRLVSKPAVRINVLNCMCCKLNSYVCSFSFWSTESEILELIPFLIDIKTFKYFTACCRAFLDLYIFICWYHVFNCVKVDIFICWYHVCNCVKVVLIKIYVFDVGGIKKDVNCVLISCMSCQ
jgi:hypothetical protein